MDEQNRNLPIFEIELWFSELKKNSKNFPNFTISKIIKFSLLTNLKKNNKISESVEFQKLANFQNLTIRKTIKVPKISNLVNYHIFRVFEQFKQT